MASESISMENVQSSTRSLNTESDYDDYIRQKLSRGVNETNSNGTASIGVLTQTVVPSSLANFVLVACLRDPEKNDVAFIGVSAILSENLFTYL